MTAEFYLYFGLQIGLDYKTAMTIPLNKLLDLVAASAIMDGGAERKMTGQDAAASLQALARMK